VAWLSAGLQADYVRYLRTESFKGILSAEICYLDEYGSPDIINAIITQSEYASRVIQRLIRFLEIGLVSIVYLGVAFIMAPYLTAFSLVIFGFSTYVLRSIFEAGYSVGDQVADANERIQQIVQATIQGIREVKLFGFERSQLADFKNVMQKFVDGKIKQRRNTEGIKAFQELVTALFVFVLIYIGIEFASMSLGALGVFLFAMFRLSPRISTLNNLFYHIESELPHLIRSQEFIHNVDLKAKSSGGQLLPDSVNQIEFDNVSFRYGSEEQVLHDITFGARKGEFVAFVGKSGAGKSTIVSLITRLYEPDSGEILGNGTPVEDYCLEAWRDHIAVVRQDPFIFNDTLKNNIIIGKPEATEEEIARVSEISKVDEFIGSLPHGYETVLGDNGVRLSGGQKQRVALARALLKDADILILDEATSDLDTSIEGDVQAAIEGMDQEYILIVIAHRLSTIENADRIYTVDNQNITDVGTHEDLISKGGKYAEFYSP
jgi:subfamily B ATP-binding cassette protein MsbA